MKKLLLLFILFILSISLASAALEITHEGPENLHAGIEAEYTLTILNKGTSSLNLFLEPDAFVSFPTSDFEYVFVEPSQIEVGAYKKGEAKVRLKLKRTVQVGRSYGTFVKITPLNNPKDYVTHDLDVYVVNPEDLISVDANIPSKLIPSREVSFNIKLSNNLNTQLQNVRMVVSSDFFDETRDMMFYGLQEREETISFAVPAATVSGDYPLSVRVYQDKKLLGKQIVNLNVVENADIKEKSETLQKFLRTIYSVEKTNTGNAIVTDSYDLKLSTWERIFVSFNINPTSKGSGNYHWEFNINPGETINIVANVNYIILFIILLVLAALIIFVYYFMTRKVHIKKEVFKMKHSKEGISQLKILIHVKNYSSRKINNISVIDLLPKILHPSAKFGTLKPDQVQKGEKGMRLIWKIDELIRGEERIISYEVDVKMSIIGKFFLPPCLVRYRVGSKVSSVRSKPLALTHDAE